MESEETYRHHGLSNPRSVRILHLYPAGKGMELRGKIKIREARLPDEDEPMLGYDALSYAWGPLEPAFQITLEDGKRLQITKNCADALFALRRPKRKCRLWVDSICLDQSDTAQGIEERSQQVQRMEFIFANARRVVAWLGIPNHDTRHTFEELSKIGKSIGVNGDESYTLGHSTSKPVFAESAKSTAPITNGSEPPNVVNQSGRPQLQSRRSQLELLIRSKVFSTSADTRSPRSSANGACFAS